MDHFTEIIKAMDPSLSYVRLTVRPEALRSRYHATYRQPFFTIPVHSEITPVVMTLFGGPCLILATCIFRRCRRRKVNPGIDAPSSAAATETAAAAASVVESAEAAADAAAAKMRQKGTPCSGALIPPDYCSLLLWAATVEFSST